MAPALPEHFEMVVSNSLVHHLPEPLPFFLEVVLGSWSHPDPGFDSTPIRKP